MVFGAGLLITSAKCTEHLKGYSQKDEFKASVFCIESNTGVNLEITGDMKISKSEISGVKKFIMDLCDLVKDVFGLFFSLLYVYFVIFFFSNRWFYH